MAKSKSKPLVRLSQPAKARSPGARRLWRGLAGLWGLVILALAGGAGTLQLLGPPAPHGQLADHPPKTLPNEAASAVTPPASAHHATHVPPAPPAIIASPAPGVGPSETALQERSTLYPNGMLPKISPNGRTARQAYAAAFDNSDRRPRIAILLAGIGMNEADSLAATNLPAAVSLAVTPYATRLDNVLAASRAAGHELLVSLPMEPQGYPLNDPGNRAMLTGASPAINAQLLEWALTRFSGYVGATGALGDMRGERFAASPDQMTFVQDTLAQRGLLYVDPRPNAPGVSRLREIGTRRQAVNAAFRSVDLVLDDPPGAAEIDRSLARLEKLARDRGAAIGLVGRPSPLSVDRIAVWATGLPARGVALAPVSVVVQMPQTATPPVTLSSRITPSQ